MSDIYRIRAIWKNGDITVRDYAFSQTVALLKGLSEKDKDIFWKGEESVITPEGHNFKLVRPEVMRKLVPGYRG